MEGPQLGPMSAVVEMHHIQRATAANLRTPFMDWAKRVPEPKAGTLDFTRWPFQAELYLEGSHEKEIVVKKATQVGVSTYLTRWVMYHADIGGLVALYVFPKLAQMLDFADARVKLAILGSDYLRGRVPPQHVQNKGLRQIGLGMVYFRGSETKTALDSVDADVLALDEYDTLTPENIPDAEKRISGSEVGLIRRVGVPSTPNWGIDKLYKESDQRHWLVKCTRCKQKWQQITFPDNVDFKKAIVVCRGCHKPLDVRKGQWVAKEPKCMIRGYHLPRLIVPHTNVKSIIKASEATNPTHIKTHHNKDLGLAYADEQGRLSDKAIAAACRAYSMAPPDGSYVGDNLVTMGVDVASSRALNVRISEHFGERKRALLIARVENFNAVETLMTRFNVKMCAIDHAPEERMARKVVERFPGRVYLVAYAPKQKLVFSVNDDMMMATVRRTEALDATYDLIRQQLNELPGGRKADPEALPEGYKDELQGEVRETEKDEFGRETTRYKKTGPNDYTHAEVYDVVATELWHYVQSMGEAQRETFQPLDDMIEFERSSLETREDDLGHYDPGLEDGGYDPGFE